VDVLPQSEAETTRKVTKRIRNMQMFGDFFLEETALLVLQEHFIRKKWFANRISRIGEFEFP